jgi:hypothetical protein
MLRNVNITGANPGVAWILSTTRGESRTTCEEIARNPYAPKGFRQCSERGLLYFYHGLRVSNPKLNIENSFILL